MTDPDEPFRTWLRGNFYRAAAHFGLAVTGEPAFGWRLRSISGRTGGPNGPRWLRVVSEDHRWLPGDFWTGNVDANGITGVPKPRVLDWTEWADPWWRRQVRAEVMDLVPGLPCAPTDVLQTAPNLPDRWWKELRGGLNVIRSMPTERHGLTAEQIGARVRTAFDVELPVARWETGHGDLHWGNLLGPDFALVDWELWGSCPVGYDAATLYLFSLLVPTVANRVHTTFADVLDTPDGRRAQVFAAARILARAEHADLARAVRQRTEPLLTRVARPG
jgi:hypothetical protein